jgi:hypothetical protein
MLETLLLAVLGSPEPQVTTIEERTASSAWFLPATVQVGEKEYDGKSLYRGEHFSKRHDDERQCVRDRESNNRYNAVSASGTYRGAYQFSPELAVGAAWMIQKDLRKNGMEKKIAKDIGESLRETSMNKWHPFWQDYAFWVVWDNGEGKNHWRHTVPGTACF